MFRGTVHPKTQQEFKQIGKKISTSFLNRFGCCHFLVPKRKNGGGKKSLTRSKSLFLHVANIFSLPRSSTTLMALGKGEAFPLTTCLKASWDALLPPPHPVLPSFFFLKMPIYQGNHVTGQTKHGIQWCQHVSSKTHNPSIVRAKPWIDPTQLGYTDLTFFED